MTEQAKNIHQAIIAVMSEIGYVQKQAGGKLGYSYAGEAALIKALRPSMIAHNVYCFVADVLSVERGTFTTKNGTVMNRTLSHGIVRFIHAPSDTHIDVHATGEGMDPGDKSANKAATGMLKYALRQTFLIETGDDPDKASSQGMEKENGQGDKIATDRSTEESKLKDRQKPSYWPSGVLKAIVEGGYAENDFEAAGMLSYSTYQGNCALGPALIYSQHYRAARDEGLKPKEAGAKGMAAYLETLKPD